MTNQSNNPNEADDTAYLGRYEATIFRIAVANILLILVFLQEYLELVVVSGSYRNSSRPESL